MPKSHTRIPFIATILFSILLFFISQQVNAQTGACLGAEVQVSFDAPELRNDGTPLSIADIKSYRVWYYLHSQGEDNVTIMDINDATQTTFTIPDLPCNDTVTIAIATINQAGLISEKTALFTGLINGEDIGALPAEPSNVRFEATRILRGFFNCRWCRS